MYIGWYFHLSTTATFSFSPFSFEPVLQNYGSWVISLGRRTGVWRHRFCIYAFLLLFDVLYLLNFGQNILYSQNWYFSSSVLTLENYSFTQIKEVLHDCPTEGV